MIKMEHKIVIKLYSLFLFVCCSITHYFSFRENFPNFIVELNFQSGVGIMKQDGAEPPPPPPPPND